MLHIAIDGPVASGKSTVAHALSQRLGIDCLPTGILYRALSWFLLENGIPFDDEEKISDLLPAITLTYENERVFVNTQDVTSHLFEEPVANGASHIGMYRRVREFMIALQKRLIADRSAVIEGRDIGIRVAPDAHLKLFLTASLDARVERRYQQYKKRQSTKTHKDIEEEIRIRDIQDRTRVIDPLQKTKDAVIIDTTNQTLDQTLFQIEKILKEKRILRVVRK